MDRISELPDNIVDRILECLSLREAVRTSTLSKTWQHKWVTITGIVLDKIFLFSVYNEEKEVNPLQYLNLVKNILLQHKGPIFKLVIYIPKIDSDNRADINLLVRFALRSGVRELSMVNVSRPQALPSCVFSYAQQIIELELRSYRFDPPLSFRGFPNLKILELSWPKFSNLDSFSSLISSCPALEVITLNGLGNDDDHLLIRAPRLEKLRIDGQLRSISLQEVQHLVVLDIGLYDMDEDFEVASDYTLNLFENLCNLKHLTLGGDMCKLCSKKALGRKFDHLKTIDLYVDLGQVEQFHFLLFLLASSPNLERLEMRIFIDDSGGDVLPETNEYADCCLEHLRTVRIGHLIGEEVELKFIEFLLGWSPVLEVVSLQFEGDIEDDTKQDVLMELARFCRASPKSQLFCAFG